MQAAVIVKRVDSLHPSNIDQQNYLSNSESFFILLLADDAILEPDTVHALRCYHHLLTTPQNDILCTLC